MNEGMVVNADARRQQPTTRRGSAMAGRDSIHAVPAVAIDAAHQMDVCR